MTHRLPEIELDRLAICEGLCERNLVRQMVRLGLVGPIQAMSISELGQGNGTDALKKYLVALDALTNIESLQAIGVLLDNEDDHVSAFNRTVRSIEWANMNLMRNAVPVPTSAFVRFTGGDWSFHSYFAPGGTEPGSFEFLVLQVFYDLYPQKMHCVDALLECSNANVGAGWSAIKLAKAKVCVALALLDEQNPTRALSLTIRERQDLIPASHPAFLGIRVFLDSI